MIGNIGGTISNIREYLGNNSKLIGGKIGNISRVFEAVFGEWLGNV